MSKPKMTREEAEQHLAQIRERKVPIYAQRPSGTLRKEQIEPAALLIKQLLADGRLSNAEFVEACKDPAHPLHDRFDWDDEEAGKIAREQQARDLIRRLTFSVQNENGDLVVVGILAPGVQGPDGKYHRVWGPDGIENPTAMEAIFRQALEELKTFIEKLERTETLQGLCAELRALERRYTLKVQRPDLPTSKK